MVKLAHSMWRKIQEDPKVCQEHKGENIKRYCDWEYRAWWWLYEWWAWQYGSVRGAQESLARKPLVERRRWSVSESLIEKKIKKPKERKKKKKKPKDCLWVFIGRRKQESSSWGNQCDWLLCPYQRLTIRLPLELHSDGFNEILMAIKCALNAM